MKDFISTFLIGLTLLSQAACVRTEHETFILSEGFVGHVIVLYSQNGGERGPVFHVPTDGILRVAGAAVGKGSNTEYLYQNKDNNTASITYLDHWGEGKTLQNISDSEASTEIFAFNDGGIGSFTIGDRTYKYRVFFIGHPADRTRMYDEMVKHLFELRKTLVQNADGQ